MRYILVILTLALFAHVAAAAVQSTQKQNIFVETGVYTVTAGNDIYMENCAGCHMPRGEGAKGVGMYPHLANNPDVESPDFTAYVILYGLRGMPSLEPYFTNEQVANVANFVSSGLGNNGTREITADEVKAIRPAPVEYIDY